MFKLYRLIRRERPQIVHTHTATAGLLGRLAAKLAGVPIVLHTFHGHVLHGYFGPLQSKALVWMERLLACLTDRIVTVSEGQRRELARYGIAPLERIAVVPLGFELGDLLSCESHRGELRRELGLSDDHGLVGIVARLVPIKNHRLFLRAARLVAEAVPQARFLVVGDGELREGLEAYARDLGLDGRVIFTGWRRDLRLCMHALQSLAPYYVALSRGVDPADLGLAGPDGAAYMQCLDPHEVTDGGTMVFRVAVEKQEGTVA